MAMYDAAMAEHFMRHDYRELYAIYTDLIAPDLHRLAVAEAEVERLRARERQLVAALDAADEAARLSEQRPFVASWSEGLREEG